MINGMLYIYTSFETSQKTRHTMCRQPYGRKIPYVQQDLRCDDFGTYRVLKIEFSNFLIIT
jgi:hypothetical protein